MIFTARGRHGRVVVQSVPITTKVVSSNPVHGEVYSIQHYMIKSVSDLRSVGGFLRVLPFPPLIKNLPPCDITEILLKVASNSINPPIYCQGIPKFSSVITDSVVFIDYILCFKAVFLDKLTVSLHIDFLLTCS